MKTPEEMYYEGWCKDCDYCFNKCKLRGKCKGYHIDEGDEDKDEETV